MEEKYIASIFNLLLFLPIYTIKLYFAIILQIILYPLIILLLLLKIHTLLSIYIHMNKFIKLFITEAAILGLYNFYTLIKD